MSATLCDQRYMFDDAYIYTIEGRHVMICVDSEHALYVGKNVSFLRI
jgi:hypothetical protein